ncbi:MAG: hypothetical protein HRF43_17490 [Phycisphaerae bacterium]|jgi:hypothetical protein
MQRIGFLCFGAVTIIAAFVQAAEGPPVEVGDRRQVFADRFWLGQARDVALVVHPPRKTGEANIKTDRPWEKGGLGPYSSVMKLGEKYLMWYHAMDHKLWDSSPTAGSICLATSSDGIHWDKPDLGLVEYQGSRQNNIVIGHGAAGLTIGQDGGMAFVDPNAPPEERLKFVCRFNEDGDKDRVNLLSSPDGIRWRLTHPGAITARPEAKGHHLDSQNVIFWDDQLRKYVCYVRRNLKGAVPQGRTVARGESEKVDGFGDVQDMTIVLQPDDADVAGNVTLVDYYSSAAIKYPFADGAYYLFPQAYYHYTHLLREFAEQVPTNAGSLDTQFASSRDGLHWERFDRRPFIPLGLKGDFDCYSTRVIYGMVPDRAGREIYMYYRGSDWLHGWDRNERNRELLTKAGVGADQDVTTLSRVVLRRDGFVSVRAGVRGGEFVTPPVTFTGRRLVINADTSATGTIRLELQSPGGEPIPGYALADADIIHTCNEINRVVKWKGGSDLSRLAGKPVRVRFVLKSADLYAFQFSGS